MVSHTDPVCGMEVDEDEGEKLDYGGKMYHFCCGGCLKIFQKNPGKYL